MTSDELDYFRSDLLRELIEANKSVHEPINCQLAAIGVAGALVGEQWYETPTTRMLARAVIAAYHCGRVEARK